LGSVKNKVEKACEPAQKLASFGSFGEILKNWKKCLVSSSNIFADVGETQNPVARKAAIVSLKLLSGPEILQIVTFANFSLFFTIREIGFISDL
jgi:hypothetical protein